VIRLWRFSIGLLVCLEVLLLVGPMAVTIIISLGRTPVAVFPPVGLTLAWYASVASNPTWTVPALTSAIAAVLVMSLATAVGVGAALLSMRSPMRGRSLLFGLFLLPLIIPSMLISLGLALVMTSLRLSGTMQGLVVAQGVIAIPYVVLNVVVALRNVDSNMERAAQSLGAGPFKTLFWVTLPLIRRGIVAGALFAFLASWDDAIIALFLNGPSLTTLPVFLLGQATDNVSPAIAAVAGYLAVLSIFACGLVLTLGMGLPALSRRSEPGGTAGV